MTVSFTKDEMEWLLSLIDIATQYLNQEDEFDKSAIDAAKKIKEKVKMAKMKENLKKVTRQLNNNPYLCEMMKGGS